MKTKNARCILAAVVPLHLGTLAGSAQINIYLYSGSETSITLPHGTYIITAYGAIRLILRADSISSAAIEIGSRERIACCSFLALSRYR
jgi:hypothetical protein